MISRNIKLHEHYKQRLKELGFPNATITATDRDALFNIINEQKPRLVFLGADYFYGSTPFMTRMLLDKFPELNIAVVTIGGYPAGLAKSFIKNGVNSYLNYTDGHDEFYEGITKIRNGKKHISSSVQELLDKGPELQKSARILTERQMEVARLICNGFSAQEIADCLYTALRTIYSHKREIYNNLDVCNEKELVIATLRLGYFTLDELVFHGREYKEIKNKKNEQWGKL